MKYIYKVEGLDCANCTAKLENELKKIDNIKNLSLSFMNKKLMYETDDEAVYDKILEVCKRVEPDVTIIGVNMAFDDFDDCGDSCVLKDESCSLEHNHKHHHADCGCHHHTHDGDLECKENNKEAIGRKSLILDGLNCANCASKIEHKLKHTHELSNVSFNFMTKTLSYDSMMDDDSAIKFVQAVVNSVEDGVKVLNAEVKKEKVKYDVELIKLIIAGFCFGMGIIINNQTLAILFFAAAYALVGLEVLVKALKNIIRGKIFDENFLMAIATIGAILIKDYAEGVAVMLFYQVGEYFQNRAVDKSRKSISNLMDIKQDFTHLKVNNELKLVKPEIVKVNDLIVCKPGEIIPLDGIVVEGSASLNTSALTGESMLKDVTIGDEVLSGVINTNGLLTIKVTKTYLNGTVNKILDMVENASSRKTKTENFITTFARYYTPIVCLLALVIAFIVPLFIEGRPFGDYLYRGLSFLVVSCPCALVISIPLGYFAGIGGLSKNGILVKGSNYIEALSKINTVLMDKTGTITEGKFKVASIHGKENLLEIAALLEGSSNHPIALSIIEYYGKAIDLSSVQDLKEIHGKGVEALINGKKAICGSWKLMSQNHINYDEVNELGTVVHVAYDDQYLGYILIKDNIKQTSKEAIKRLKQIGIKNIVMVTGDNNKAAEAVGKEVGISMVYSDLLPDQKVEICSKYIENSKVAFVGDGINDAPVLALADVGISMGALGSDAAIEASDVVLMHDDLNSIVEAIKRSKKTQGIVIENIFIALGIKFIVLLLVTLGFANMWAAVFADVGVAFIAICNSIRALK